MKKVKDFLATKEAIKKARVDLERKTEKALWDSTYNGVKSCRLAHIMLLD